mgnify:CR=1 FL=1
MSFLADAQLAAKLGSGYGRNDLQPPAEASCPEVTQVARWLEARFGNSRMTGSGSAVFSWVDQGMQVLIKDNGVEIERRSQVTLDLEDSGYTIEDDTRSLVETIKGAGLTAMRERAALYGGSVDATRVPGVGFTVSAIFPHLRALAGSQ